jgi:hypothetical protein
MVEGHRPQVRQSVNSLKADFHDPSHSHIGVLQYRHSRHTQRRDSLRSEEFGSPRIRLSGSRAIVRRTVHFDGEPGGGAIEVQDIDTRRMLPPKFQT